MPQKRPDEDRNLPCVLNEEQLLLKGSKLAAGVHDLESLDAEKKAWMAEWNGRKEAVSGRVLLLKDEVKNQRETRPVPCYWVAETHRWLCLRSDTNAVVDEQPITASDRQELLGFIGGAASGGEKN